MMRSCPAKDSVPLQIKLTVPAVMPWILFGIPNYKKGVFL